MSLDAYRKHMEALQESYLKGETPLSAEDVEAIRQQLSQLVMSLGDNTEKREAGLRMAVDILEAFLNKQPRSDA